MALENILKEIEAHKQQEISRIEKEYKEKVKTFIEEAKSKITEIEQYYEKKKREDAIALQRREIEIANLEARRIITNKKNQILTNVIVRAQELLNQIKNTSFYSELLHRMIEVSQRMLGKDVTIHIRSEDRALIGDIDTIEIIEEEVDPVGGIIAISKDQTREINITFSEVFQELKDELLNKLSEYIR